MAMAASILLVAVLSFSSVSTSSSGKTLLGGSSSLCTRGPGHWCQNVETAQSCDALKYCRQKVWKSDNPEMSAASKVSSVPMIPVMDQAVEVVPMVSISQVAKALPAATASLDLCTYCEEVVNYAKILLGNPDAEKEIESLLEGMCGQLGPLKEPCEEFIQQNIEKIIHTLAHVDTKTVCIQLHMCSADERRLAAGAKIAFASKSNNVLAPLRSLACGKCRSLSVDLLEKLQASHDALSKLSVNFCHLLGRDDILCHHHTGIFLAAAKVVGSKDYFCNFLCDEKVSLTCDAKRESNRNVTTPPPATTSTAPATTTSPNPQPPACTQCIQALTTIKEDLTAKLGCLEEKLETYCDAFPPLAAECKAAIEGFFKPLHAQIDGLDPKTICTQMGVCNPTKFKLTPNANLCLTCEQSVNYAKILVGEPGVEAQVEQVLIGMCQNLGPLKDGCVSYVEENLQQIFDKLKHVDTRVICQDLGFCAAKKPTKSNFFEKTENLLPVGILGGVDRPVLEIHNEKKGDAGEKANSVIRLSGQKSKMQRVEVHRAESEVSVVKMEKGAAPAKTAATTTPLELPQMSCFTCKFIMGEGKRILAEDSTINQLTKLSETICNDLKGDLKAQCADFLSMYAKTYIKMAVEQLNPDQVCVIMGACQGQPAPTSHALPGNPFLCFGCQHGLRELSNYWRENHGLQAKVLNLLQSACLKLPESQSIQECVDEVDVMFPVFAKLVANLDVKTACRNAGVCPDLNWKNGLF